MGAFYHHGQGVAQDFTAAREWYEKAAQQGHGAAKEAIEELGVAATAEGQSSTLNTTTALLPEAVETGDDDDNWLQGHSSVTGGEAASRPTITKAKTKKVKQSKKGGKKKKK